MGRIRVLVVDDHAILRDGIRSLLERQNDIDVIGEAENGAVGLALAEELKPDIVLMDVAMPEMNGLEATRKIKEQHPEMKVLILTQHDNQEYIEPLLKAGASGYVLKRSGGKEVVSAIRQVFEQGGFLEPSIVRQVLDHYQNDKEPKAEPTPYLTEREREVLKLIVQGKSTKEIATQLNISPKTVSVHRSNLMTKLNVHNTLDLLRYLSRHKIDDIGHLP
jgi:two-component system, NarL family, response regulator NreC